MFGVGDFVQVVMTHNDCFDFQTGPSFNATILYSPGGAGDMWHFSVTLTDHVAIIAVNPSSGEFIGLVKIT